MSMHKIPLTPLEEAGLKAHGLDIGTPSQLSDVFRQGVAWALADSATPQPEEVKTAIRNLRCIGKTVLSSEARASMRADLEGVAQLLTRLSTPQTEQPAAAPEGWKLLPPELTLEMQRAAKGISRWQYDDLLAAAPLAQTEQLKQVLQEMRDRRVNHGRDASPTLENWADRIEAALEGKP